MSILTVLLIIIVVGCLFLVFYYNSFISKRNLADQAFSTIDVMLKKRCDLVPNLVASVKEYMKHEAGTLTKIAELRSKAMDNNAPVDERIAANNQLGRSLRGLMVQVENYPDLKANENFLQLQRTLNEIEEQLSAARRGFNAAVTDFNNATDMFPGNVLAGFFGFKRRELLAASEEERKNPDVKSLFN